jgi:hypothetical protein
MRYGLGFWLATSNSSGAWPITRRLDELLGSP